MNKTKKIAFERMKLGKATKAELEILLKWAENEIDEWNMFYSQVKKQLNSKIYKKIL